MTRSRQTADWGSRAGLAKIVPSSITVGSGTGSADSLGTVTFSGASSFSLNDVFSATYSNYKVLLYTTPSTANALTLRWRVSGADNSSALYFTQLLQSNSSSTVSAFIDSSATSFSLTASNAGISPIVMEIFNPFSSTETTNVETRLLRGGEPLIQIKANYFNSTTSFTGFSIIASTGTLSGTARVYGYN